MRIRDLTLPLALLASSLPSSLVAADETRTWEGTWNNRKFNTSGPLKCVATLQEDGEWKATFSGKFQGDPFRYDVSFQSKPGRGRTSLSGTATLRGDDYEWAGAIKGKTLTGSYKSTVGYFGNFVLREK